MTIREAFGIVALVIVLQLFIGLLLYSILQLSPVLDIYTVLVAVGIMSGVAGGVAAALTLVFKNMPRNGQCASP